MSGLTLVRNPGEPVPGLADRGLDALMRLAVDQIGVCLEVISEAQIRTAGADSALAACADGLGSGPAPAPSRVRTRHLQAVDGGAR